MRAPYAAIFAILVLATGPASGAADDVSSLWTALRTGGHIAVMRHALAPGTGDPASFRIDDCGTQRNLSDQGRAQARDIGARFRANGIAAARVFSSQWCRCLETADLIALGPVTELPALNSFFADRDRGPGQTEKLKTWIGGQDLSTPLVLVTHQVNITALTDVYPTSGEIVVLRRGGLDGLEVIGTIEPE